MGWSILGEPLGRRCILVGRNVERQHLDRCFLGWRVLVGSFLVRRILVGSFVERGVVEQQELERCLLVRRLVVGRRLERRILEQRLVVGRRLARTQLEVTLSEWPALTTCRPGAREGSCPPSRAHL